MVKISFLLVFLQLILICYGKSGFPSGYPQDWGYVKAREGANMFWWLHETVASMNPTDRPLVIWLQGGPGASGTETGNFEEFGPLDENLNRRDDPWIKYVNTLFIDNPVGSGFSYVDAYKYLTTDNHQIARDLVETMRGFYKARPEFEKVPLYIFSQSYGGKMNVEFAYELYQEIKQGKIQCNLKGVALGNSWIDPVESTLSWAPLLWQSGHVDIDGYQAILNKAKLAEKYLNEGKYSLSTDMWLQTEYVVLDYAFGIDFYNIMSNIRYPSSPKSKITMEGRREVAVNLLIRNQRQGLLDNSTVPETRKLSQIMNQMVKPALGIPSHVVHGSQSGAVFDALAGDFMKPVVNFVEKLLNETNVEVNVYTGQVDLICSTPGTIEWINRMNWNGSQSYKSSKRTAYSVQNVIEGFYRGYKNFHVYWVSRAGHMPPSDNPPAMQYVLRKITKFDQM